MCEMKERQSRQNVSQQSTHIASCGLSKVLYDGPQDFLVLQQDAGKYGDVHRQQYTALLENTHTHTHTYTHPHTHTCTHTHIHIHRHTHIHTHTHTHTEREHCIAASGVGTTEANNKQHCVCGKVNKAPPIALFPHCDLPPQPENSPDMKPSRSPSKHNPQHKP